MRILLVILIIIFILSAAFLVTDYINKKKMDDLGEKFSVSSSDTKKSVKVDVPVDFKALKKINKDVYAWINIPGTKVDYPILQNEKDEYYLNRNIDKEWSVYGCIFSEAYNKKDFSDFNTVVYGHNMRNETMFGGLKRFRDEKFFKKHRYINVYMPNRILKYEIFAACSWDNKHIMASNNFSLAENREYYLERIFSIRDMDSQILKDAKVTADDRIITLSTCMNNKAKRFIVSGVLVYDSQNP